MNQSDDLSRLPERLSALDYLLHRGDTNPRTRSGFMSVEILAGTPSWDTFRQKMDHISRQVIRFRQKIVAPVIPTVLPQWVIDPDFDLDFHVRRIHITQPGKLRDLFDLAEVLLRTPLDLSRPLWTATLVEGLEQHCSAILFHLSHVISDGVGARELFRALYEPDGNQTEDPLLDPPIAEEITATSLALQSLKDVPYRALDGSLSVLQNTLKLTGKLLRNPDEVVADIVNYTRSGMRITRQAAPASSLLLPRSLMSRAIGFDCLLADLRDTAHQLHVSINDLYLAALSGALGKYHRTLGCDIRFLPMAVPINTRDTNDPLGGNQFTGVNLAAPIGITDPIKRVRFIQYQMNQRQEEKALDLTHTAAPLLNLVPNFLLDKIATSVLHSDIQASNVAFYPTDTYFMGTKIIRHYVLGPLPGVAIMAILLSRAGQVSLTVRYDKASITDDNLFAQCITDSLNEYLAFAPHTTQPCVCIA